VLGAVVFLIGLHESALGAKPTWKAGTAKTVITPKQPLWMAGYATRTHPADGTLHDLYMRVLALEDAAGRRAVIVSSDLLGIPRSIAENVTAAIEKQYNLSRAQVMLNASHTHTGPVLRSALYDAYPIDEQKKKRIEAYSTELEATIVRTVGEALAHLAPATVSVAQGSADFAVNRRTNREPDVPMLREQHALKGPVDHSVPVLTARSPDGKLLAVVFGYACHNTCLSFYEWSGDYAGFAETNLEQTHPGAVALFHMGCGGDQNPLPRRTVELCRKYGKKMSDAVEAVVSQPMEPLAPSIETAFETVTLHLGAAPSRATLKRLASGPDSYIRRWAARLLGEMDAGHPFPRTYPYPVQVWKMGHKQLWVVLGGEVVVDYALRLKGNYGPETWVTSYANDVMAYIPSLRVLREGGYEGNTSMMVYGMPAERWGEDVEELILSAVDRLVKQVDKSK